MEWRIISDNPQYEVSEYGQVRHARLCRQNSDHGYLRGYINERGYHTVCFVVSGKRRTRHVAYYVATAFIGPRPVGMTINHKDGNKLNDHWSNLEYCTRLENVRHAFACGLMANTRVVTPWIIAQKIRTAYDVDTTQSYRALARQFGVTQSVVRRIVQRKTFIDTTSEARKKRLSQHMQRLYQEGRIIQRVGYNNPQSKLTEEQYRAVIQLVRQGWSRHRVAKKFGVSHTTINKIVREYATVDTQNNIKIPNILISGK